MSIYADALCLYGSYINTDKEIIINEEDSSEECDECIFISQKLLDKYNVNVINEPYCSDWIILGIDFLDKDTVKTIDNLIHIHGEWNNFIHELKNNNINISFKEDAKIILRGYFN